MPYNYLQTQNNFSDFFDKDPVKNSNSDYTSEVKNMVEKETTSNTSNMNFVIWFMGSKQNPSTTIISAGENTRKQIMTSGLAPNRLLIKAFLKKAVNFEIASV